MNRLLLPLAVLAGVLSPSLLNAQIAFGGEALGLRAQHPWMPEPTVVEFPTVDAHALKAEDEARYASGVKGPWRFGFNHVADIGTANSGVWHTLRNGDRVWRTQLLCPGAYSINFRFDRYVVPEGASVYVYNEEGAQLGAFTAKSSPGRTTMGVTQLPGERITVEYHEPAAVAGAGELHIDQVTHAYRDVFGYAKDLGSSGACNINVICPDGDDWRDQIRSVAIITVGGSGFCTGTMINNCEQDSTPYFLTADHCLDADVENWVFRFNWDSPVCDPTENGPIDQTVSGCTMLVNSAGTDVALLELSSIPPLEYNVFWSGWDKSTTPATSVVGIHHPAGDIKKFSRSDDPVIQGMMSGAECWQVQVWNAGTTEPGSSGSGLWNQDKRLVGQLFGGEANCANSVNDFYGRLDVSWPLLEEYLGTCGDTLDGWEPGELVEISNDAAVTSIQNVPVLICDDNQITPRITLKNNGNVLLTSIILTYSVVGVPEWIYPWNGSLQPGQTVNIDLPTVSVPPGEHVLTVTASSPNGAVDQVEGNDSWSFAFSANSPGGEITFALTLDNFGTDITWSLASELGTVMYTGGPYADLNAGEIIEVPFCLTNGCYVFTINDVFGDGICCEQGEGSYVIYDADSVVHAVSDGTYGDQNINTFCLAGVSVPERNGPGDFTVFPNPTADHANVRLSGTQGPVRLELRDTAGRLIRTWQLADGVRSTNVELGDLGNGLYLLSAEHAGGRVVRPVVVRN